MNPWLSAHPAAPHSPDPDPHGGAERRRRGAGVPAAAAGSPPGPQRGGEEGAVERGASGLALGTRRGGGLQLP